MHPQLLAQGKTTTMQFANATSTPSLHCSLRGAWRHLDSRVAALPLGKEWSSLPRKLPPETPKTRESPKKDAYVVGLTSENRLLLQALYFCLLYFIYEKAERRRGQLMHRQLLNVLRNVPIRPDRLPKTSTVADVRAKMRSFLECLSGLDVTKNMVANAINQAPEMDQHLTELLEAALGGADANIEGNVSLLQNGLKNRFGFSVEFQNHRKFYFEEEYGVAIVSRKEEWAMEIRHEAGKQAYNRNSFKGNGELQEFLKRFSPSPPQRAKSLSPKKMAPPKPGDKKEERLMRLETCPAIEEEEGSQFGFGEERTRCFLGEPVQQQIIAVSVVESETFVNEEASTDASVGSPPAGLFGRAGNNAKRLTTLFGTRFNEEMKESQQQVAEVEEQEQQRRRVPAFIMKRKQEKRLPQREPEKLGGLKQTLSFGRACRRRANQ